MSPLGISCHQAVQKLRVSNVTDPEAPPLRPDAHPESMRLCDETHRCHRPEPLTLVLFAFSIEASSCYDAVRLARLAQAADLPDSRLPERLPLENITGKAA